MAMMKSVMVPVLSPCWSSLLLVKLQVSTVNNSDGVYDRTCLTPSCSSLLLGKFQVLTINGSDGVCDGTCFHLHAVVVCF